VWRQFGAIRTDLAMQTLLQFSVLLYEAFHVLLKPSALRIKILREGGG